jgi:protein O-GlcNAc transferase
MINKKLGLKFNINKLLAWGSYLLVGLGILFYLLVMADFNGYLTWPRAQANPADPLEAAMVEFKEAIELEPGNPEGYYWLSKAYEQAGQPELVIEIYQQAVENNSEAAWPRVSLGKLYLETGQVEAAIAEFEQAIEREPDYQEAYTALAEVYQSQQHNPEAALKLYEQAVAVNPDRAWPYLGLGKIYLTTGKVEQALTAYEQAIGLEPDNIQSYFDLGQFYHQQGQLNKALIYYRQIVNVSPDTAWPRINLGAALFEAGQETEALAMLETAISMEPTSSQVYQQVGKVLLPYQVELAQTYLEQAVKLDPQNVLAAISLAQLFRDQEKYEQALTYAQKAEFLALDNETQGSVHLEQALTYQAQQEPDAARQHFLKAVELLPTNPHVHLNFARFYSEQGQIEQAILSYRQAITLAPNIAQVYLELGQVLLMGGHQEEATSSLMTGLSLANGDPQAYLVVGNIARQHEKWSQMAKIYEDALAHGAVNVDIYIQLGDAYKQLGQLEEAHSNYQQAARLAPDHPEVQQRLIDKP